MNMRTRHGTTLRRTTIGLPPAAAIAGGHHSPQNKCKDRSRSTMFPPLRATRNIPLTSAKHIPYRNHPLTMLMSDSLGGNAKTLMFVNISADETNGDETISSLNYASRVKKVSNKSSKQIETNEIRKLKRQLAKLNKGK